MARTRRNAKLAAAAVALGGGSAVVRRRRAGRRTPAERGMCFQIASFEAVDAGRDFERVVL
jgi:hypothetical protein